MLRAQGTQHSAWCSVLRALGAGRRVQGAECRAQGTGQGSRAHSSGLWALGLGLSAQCSVLRAWGTGCRAQAAGMGHRSGCTGEWVWGWGWVQGWGGYRLGPGLGPRVGLDSSQVRHLQTTTMWLIICMHEHHMWQLCMGVDNNIEWLCHTRWLHTCHASSRGNRYDTSMGTYL